MTAPQAAAETAVKKLPPMHPGEVLREEFMAPYGLSSGKVAKACGVPRTRIERVANEAAPITPDTAARIGLYFGTSTEFWLNLQARYDALSIADLRTTLAKAIDPFEPKAA